MTMYSLGITRATKCARSSEGGGFIAYTNVRNGNLVQAWNFLPAFMQVTGTPFFLSPPQPLKKFPYGYAVEPDH